VADLETTNIAMSKIDVAPDRARALDPVWCEALAKLIAQQGLYHPILVRPIGDRYQLIAGLHRLYAYRILKKRVIPSRLSKARTDHDARLEEVMENLGRVELIALDRCHHLYELKRAWEAKYPHTANGGDTRSKAAKTRRQTLPSDPKPEEIFGFARANAEKLGLSERAIRLAVAVWDGLSPSSRNRLVGTALARKQTELKALSKQSHKQQGLILDLVLGDANVTNVAGAIAAIEGGVVPTAQEKQLAALRQQVNALPDPVFARLVLDNEERIIAALKRHERLT